MEFNQINLITCTPETRDPARTPESVSTPKKYPTKQKISIFGIFKQTFNQLVILKQTS